MELNGCTNCAKTGATETWRKKQRRTYCNACAVYLDNHGSQRPQRLCQQALARQASSTQSRSRAPKRQRTLEPQEVCACDDLVSCPFATCLCITGCKL